MGRRVLIVDDRLESLWTCADVFRERGYSVSTCREPGRALDAFSASRPDVVLLDIKMPGRDGFDLLRDIRKKDRRVCVIMLSAYGDASTVVKAMKLGADNFAEKGMDPEKILITVEKELRSREMQLELASLKAEKDLGKVGIDHIIGESEPMQRVKAQIRALADTDAAVFLSGESGVGKDLVAGVLHYESSRRSLPFQHLFCPSIPKTLFESEIFGHERGSFTGAHKSRKGIIEAAGDGTVFLNEIVDIPPELQATLLMVIDTGVYTKVGSEGETGKTRARFIAATNADIGKAMNSGEFRRDLFFRLNEAWIELPALRTRGEDILVLAEHFLRFWSLRLGLPMVELSEASRDSLLKYNWPGNVRELETIMKRVIMAGGEHVIKADGLLSDGMYADRAARASGKLKDVLRREISEIEKHHIADALRRFAGSRKKAAAFLDISYRSLLAKMKLYDLRSQF
jgi:two-component system response regulator AtoC